MGGAYEYEEIGRSKRLERRRAAAGLGAFFVVVGTLGWNRKSLGAGAPASARGASRRQAPSASPREVGSAKPWQADAAAFPSNLRLSVSYYGAPSSLPLMEKSASICASMRGDSSSHISSSSPNFGGSDVTPWGSSVSPS